MNNTLILNFPKGAQDEPINDLKKSINLRKYIDNNNIESTEKSEKIVFLQSRIKIRLDSNNKYVSDFVLKLPYNSDLDINNDVSLTAKEFAIIDYINYTIGGQDFAGRIDMHQISFYNWLYGKEIIIKDGFIYIPISHIINIYNTNKFMYHSFHFDIKFNNNYINKIKKDDENNNTENINFELLYQEYDIDDNKIKKDLIRENPNTFQELLIQNQEVNQSFIGDKGSGQTCFIPFNHPVFCLYVYGFDKEDVYDFQLIFNNEYIYDMILKEKIPNIYVLEFAEPLLYNRVFDEPLTNIDIYNKKTINFSRIDNVRIKFRKSNNKDLNIHIVALNYNIERTMSGMMGLVFGN